MKLTLIAMSALLLAACQQQPSNLSPESRAMLLGAMISRPQPQPYYHQPYMMPVRSSGSFSCSHTYNSSFCY